MNKISIAPVKKKQCWTASLFYIYFFSFKRNTKLTVNRPPYITTQNWTRLRHTVWEVVDNHVIQTLIKRLWQMSHSRLFFLLLLVFIVTFPHHVSLSHLRFEWWSETSALRCIKIREEKAKHELMGNGGHGGKILFSAVSWPAKLKMRRWTSLRAFACEQATGFTLFVVKQYAHKFLMIESLETAHLVVQLLLICSECWVFFLFFVFTDVSEQKDTTAKRSLYFTDHLSDAQIDIYSHSSRWRWLERSSTDPDWDLHWKERHYWLLEPIPDVAKESKIRNFGLFSFNPSVFGLHSKVKATAGSSSEG